MDKKNDIVLELSQVKKSYGTKVITPVLKGIDLKFYRGEFVAIVGESGSGKSTLLNMIGGLDKPTSGKIYFKGIDISNKDMNSMAKFRNSSIGFIFQFHYLLPEFSVLENVLIPTWIESGYDNYDKKQEALDILEYVGLKDY
ncbi:MAG: ABC transporter ATP-binding protein, partial [Fusobacteriaceae bacterium]